MVLMTVSLSTGRLDASAWLLRFVTSACACRFNGSPKDYHLLFVCFQSEVEYTAYNTNVYNQVGGSSHILHVQLPFMISSCVLCFCVNEINTSLIYMDI